MSYFVSVLTGMVGAGVTPQHDKVGLTIRQRKFPGPAGLLPDKVSGALVSVIDQLSINIMVFWNVTAYSLADMFQRKLLLLSAR